MILKFPHAILSPPTSLVQIAYSAGRSFSTLAEHFRIAMGAFRKCDAMA